MTRIRLLYPFPLWTLILFLFVYVFLEPFVLLMLLALTTVSERYTLLGTPQEQLRREFDRIIENYGQIYVENASMQLGLLIFTGLAYGTARAILFHPLFNVKYRDALALLPWKPTNPLPLGPLRPSMHDALILVFLCALAGRANISSIATVAAALVGTYAVIVAVAAIVTGAHFTGWITLLLLMPFPAAGDLGTAFAPFLILGLIAADRAAHHSMRRFPWSHLGVWERFSNMYNEAQGIRTYGWPLVHLRGAAEAGLSTADKVTITALATVVQVLVLTTVSVDEAKAVLFTLTVFWAISLMFYLADRVWYYRPPISLLGRITTRRFIIPQYDKVLIAPAVGGLAVLVSHVTVRLDPQIGLYCASVLLPFAFSILVFPVPFRRHWKATGLYRVAPPAILEQEVKRI